MTAALQVLRTLDKFDAIGRDGVVELLQKPAAEFGADLDPVQAGLVELFLDCSGTSNDQTIDKVKRWFANARNVRSRVDMMALLEGHGEGETAFDRLLRMPANDDNTWSDGRRPRNIAWALDDLATALRFDASEHHLTMNVVATSEGTQLKARSKAQKLARRRGRPRMDATAGREPNGRPSRRKASKDARRHETEGNNMNVAVARRIKDYDLVDIRMKGGKILTAAEQAIDPRRGYVLGLLLLDGKITEPQHDAGLRYAEDMSRYYGLTGIRFPSAMAQDLFAVRGDDGDTTKRRAEAASKARAKMAVLRDELLASGDINSGRKILHTVNEIALLDTSGARLWPEHMLGFLRKGLNRLVKHYGVQGN